MRALLEDSAANRPAEVSAMLDVLAALGADPTSLLYEAVDTERAAVIGHSWGGYTAIVAATRDRRFRAVVAMAPVVNATLEQAERALRVPVMVMGSRLDDVTPFPPQERLFKALPAGIPRYLVAFPRGGHTAYSGLCPADSPGCRADELGQERAHALVGAYVTAFLRRYLLADDRYESLLDRSMGGGDVEFTARAPQEP
jgi:predicted dienelactone hydrolase